MKKACFSVVVLIVALIGPLHALEIEYALSTSGSTQQYNFTVVYRPAFEQIGAIRVCMKYDQDHVSSFQAWAPASGAWSEITPSFAFSQGQLAVAAICPAISRSADTSNIPILSGLVAFVPPAVHNPIDSIWIDECLDVEGNPIAVSLQSLPMQVGRGGPALSMSQMTMRSLGSRHQLSFSLGKAHQVSAKVVDIKGRVVTTLLNHAQLKTGIHTIVWGGATSAGTSASPGSYFIQLSSPGFTYSKKVSFVR